MFMNDVDRNLKPTYKLTIRQIPIQVLSQTLQLLSLPILDLDNEIKTQLEQNPLLEIDEESTLSLLKPESSEVNIDEVQKSMDSFEDVSSSVGEISDTYEVSRLKEFESYERKSYTRVPIFEAIASEAETLQEHLIFQAKLDIEDERLFTLATYIIYELDENGFFRGELDNFRNIEQYVFSDEEIEGVRERIKRYDPVGCGSRTLEEALITQMETYYPNLEKLEIYKKIVENDLKLLAENPAKLKEKYNISEEDIENLKIILKSLDPKPGINFSKTPVFIIPEAIIRESGEETLEIEYNDSYIPVLKIKREYINAIKRSNSPELRSEVVKARNFIVALEYRKKILRAIIEKIVQHQREFIMGKQSFLNPLLLEDVSRELGVNASTVSRAIKDKFVLTPIGLLPLRYFFTKYGKSLTGEEVSIDRIKKLIKEIIDNEGEKTLSDEKIKTILLNKGIKISRRTVTKYRELLGIPPAHRRKNEKNIRSFNPDR